MRKFIDIIIEATQLKFNSAFNTWFNGSKVVDSRGNPLVVYHGAALDFDAFDGSKGRFEQDKDVFFFTDHHGTADAYAGEHETGVVMAVYLALKNPFVLQAETDGSAIETWDWNVDKIRKAAQGHDGVIIYDEGEENLYVAFRPSQIKSVNNKGTFSADNPSMKD